MNDYTVYPIRKDPFLEGS